jgi:hypothetical protein
MAIIELIGCTSAGKSTLSSHILQFYHGDVIDISQGEDFLLNQFGLSRVGNSKIRVVIVNLIALLVASVNMGKHRNYFSFAFRTITQSNISTYKKIYLIRNILKTIGIYIIAFSRANDNQIILLDEGTLQSLSAIFVNVKVNSSETELAEFVRFVPLPDAAVYIREKEDILIERTMVRRHNRIQSGNRGEVEKFVRSSIKMFERLSLETVVQSILFVVFDRQVYPPQNSSNNHFNQFVLNLIRACLYESNGEPGIQKHFIHLDLKKSSSDTELAVENKS